MSRIRYLNPLDGFDLGLPKGNVPIRRGMRKHGPVLDAQDVIGDSINLYEVLPKNQATGIDRFRGTIKPRERIEGFQPPEMLDGLEGRIRRNKQQVSASIDTDIGINKIRKFRPRNAKRRNKQNVQAQQIEEVVVIDAPEPVFSPESQKSVNSQSLWNDKQQPNVVPTVHQIQNQIQPEIKIAQPIRYNINAQTEQTTPLSPYNHQDRKHVKEMAVKYYMATGQQMPMEVANAQKQYSDISEVHEPQRQKQSYYAQQQSYYTQQPYVINTYPQPSVKANPVPNPQRKRVMDAESKMDDVVMMDPRIRATISHMSKMPEMAKIPTQEEVQPKKVRKKKKKKKKKTQRVQPVVEERVSIKPRNSKQNKKKRSKQNVRSEKQYNIVRDKDPSAQIRENKKKITNKITNKTNVSAGKKQQVETKSRKEKSERRKIKHDEGDAANDDEDDIEEREVKTRKTVTQHTKGMSSGKDHTKRINRSEGKKSRLIIQ